MGGTVIHIEDAEEGNRSVQMAFGIDEYLSLFESSLVKFLKLDIEYVEDEDAEERLGSRSEFLRRAAETHPTYIAELSRILRRLEEEAHEALGRLNSLRVKAR